MKTPILFAAWTALVIMAVPSESQGRGGQPPAPVKPSPSISPGSGFAASARAAVLDSLNQSLRTQRQHVNDSSSIKNTVEAAARKSFVDYSAFEGWEIEGRPSVVTVRGEVAVRDRKFAGTIGRGKLLARDCQHF